MATRTSTEVLRELRQRKPVDYFEEEGTEEEDNIEEDNVISSEEECDEFDFNSEDSEEESESEQEPSGTRARKYIKGKNGYKWSKNPPETRGQRSMPIQMHFPTPTASAMNIRSPIDAWGLLITDEILNIIVSHTNERIRDYLNTQESDERKNNSTFREIDIIQLKAFIGLLYFAGLQHESKMSILELWSSDFGTSFFATIMSRERFKFIARFIRFDDRETRAERRQTDLFAPIREIWEMFIEKCRTHYSPSNNLTIDEQLLGFRGNYGARVYIKSKPAKYGIKIISMNDAKTAYMYNAIPYAGKVVTERNEKVPEYYVRVLTEPIHHTNRVITFDNWFTTVNICEKLHNEYGLEAVGTIRKNKREIPKSFVAPASAGVSRYAYQNNKRLTLVSFCPKRNKVVLLLSTVHRKGISGESGKPEIIEFYNSTKGGVDIFDKMVSSYTTARKTLRWPVRVFFGMLDQSGINAIILHNFITANANMTRIEFLKKLVLELTRPHLEIRKMTSSLPRNLRASISIILGDDNPQPANDRMEKRKRCYFCPVGKDKKTFMCCIGCGRAICEDHRSFICAECK